MKGFFVQKCVSFIILLCEQKNRFNVNYVLEIVIPFCFPMSHLSCYGDKDEGKETVNIVYCPTLLFPYKNP